MHIIHCSIPSDLSRNVAEISLLRKKIPVLLTVYVENRKEPYGIKSVYWNRYCSGVSWTVTFHVYRFDFIGGMKDGMLEMANGHFFRGIRKINSRSSPTAYCFSQHPQGSYLIRLKYM